MSNIDLSNNYSINKVNSSILLYKNDEYDDINVESIKNSSGVYCLDYEIKDVSSYNNIIIKPVVNKYYIIKNIIIKQGDDSISYEIVNKVPNRSLLLLNDDSYLVINNFNDNSIKIYIEFEIDDDKVVNNFIKDYTDIDNEYNMILKENTELKNLLYEKDKFINEHSSLLKFIKGALHDRFKRNK